MGGVHGNSSERQLAAKLLPNIMTFLALTISPQGYLCIPNHADNFLFFFPPLLTQYK